MHQHTVAHDDNSSQDTGNQSEKVSIGLVPNNESKIPPAAN